MAEEHDKWLEGLGLDIDGLRDAAGKAKAGGPFENPDLAQRDAGLDAATDFAKGFAKGVAETAGGIAQSSAAMTNPFGILGNVTAAAADAPGARKSLLPDLTIDLSEQNQQKQVATAQSIIDNIEDPIGTGADAGVKIATSDHPFETIGEGLGKGLVIGAGAVAGAGELGVAEAGVAEAGAAEEAGAAAAASDDAAFAQTQPQGVAVTVNDASVAGAAPEAPVGVTVDDPALAATSPAPEPISELDPALRQPAPEEPVPDSGQSPLAISINDIVPAAPEAPVPED